ncbi:MAG: hypothetical protein QM500_06670, partial [Methylococcales bacterium]
RKKPFWPLSPFIFVTRVNYYIQMNEKIDSKGLSLATVSILGQPPRGIDWRLYRFGNDCSVTFSRIIKNAIYRHDRQLCYSTADTQLVKQAL